MASLPQTLGIISSPLETSRKRHGQAMQIISKVFSLLSVSKSSDVKVVPSARMDADTPKSAEWRQDFPEIESARREVEEVLRSVDNTREAHKLSRDRLKAYLSAQSLEEQSLPASTPPLAPTGTKSTSTAQ